MHCKTNVKPKNKDQMVLQKNFNILIFNIERRKAEQVELDELDDQ